MQVGQGVVIAAALLASGVPRPALEDENHRVRVRVYDSAGLDAPTKALALQTAAAVLAGATVTVEWELCAAAACSAPLADDLVVRIVRTQERGVALGDALIDMGTGSAVFATIYFNRVHLLARSAAADPAQLLGYAVAHELGHLLLASHAHSPDGLMRPTWRERDLRVARDGDWRFSAQDAATIRDRLEAAHVSSNVVWTTR